VSARATAIDLGFVGLLTALGGAVYFAAGIRFDASPFPGYIQFIDDELLGERMLESIWYSHAHPPGLNLLAGVAYRAFGDAAPTFLSLLFHGLGLVLAVALFALTLRLTGSRIAAFAATAAIVLSPGFVLYENWLMYTFLEAVLLTASAVALYKTLDRGSAAWAAAMFVTLAALVLTRGLFHLGWLALVVAYVAWAAPDRLRILKAAALPFAVATLWYAKNWFYFGTFAGSTMFGLGLSNIGTLTVPRADLQPLVEQGIVSPLALVSRYENVALLFAVANDSPSGIPVLDRPLKSDGEYNYNYLPLIALNRQYARDSLNVIRRHPAGYAIGVVIANRLFFSPSSMNEYFAAENRAAAKPFERVFNPVFYGVPAEPGYIAQPHFGFDVPPSLEVNTSAWLIALWVLVLVFGWLQVRPAFFARSCGDRAARITLGYLLFVMVYVHALGTLVELGENYRYRFAVEPFLAVAAAVIATDAVRRLAARLRLPR
jgi:4-amino-4-deoxy-L-arabinose transferase-like glycosyltransferase